ncbi:AAA family ATPase [Raineyella fluvialis]|uniref:Gluconokinase n=2 Tax=Raineyella fluvialis TaxID=2662261 RepID=A0A5Q2FE96_9ACTN|nr:AAA family ATPase [Raineyella fluvialis]
MGVAGSGKSTVAHGLAARLGWPMAEGDEFHSVENIAKMASGHPLTDDDRWPWLDRIVEWTAQQDRAGHCTLVTCSALRRAYRDRLRTAPGRTVFVHLVGSADVVADRLAHRTDHFMPSSLLPSQLATLEPLGSDEDGFSIDIEQDVDEVLDSIVDALSTNPQLLKGCAE